MRRTRQPAYPGEKRAFMAGASLPRSELPTGLAQRPAMHAQPIGANCFSAIDDLVPQHAFVIIGHCPPIAAPGGYGSERKSPPALSLAIPSRRTPPRSLDPLGVA